MVLDRLKYLVFARQQKLKYTKTTENLFTFNYFIFGLVIAKNSFKIKL